ncbi:DUF262 domain-containing protein [Bacteroides fragilis]|uniref:DUF262 domain-containing protein n=1 Tax=Bacteroides fragilis TaxID=817 RepID=UPI000EE0D207|nr:DUF262 domain-containing protein [Bacteroides fragilis]MCE8598270.1 DUF262 domain-containing protein [Bacteroides fragilis]MCE8656221.1 DUF262 domain-containing protein [Bacteroides fragilis]RGN99342.1 DUF262 domain-containing protein [Bacteroides fragilis]RGO60481.1 DUF262 domain-containing protein [Bacteroides fragilis]
MATDIKKTNAEELSYMDIVRKEGNIKIPLIQRDYAQGRPSKKVTSIREKFVKDLYNSIITNTRFNLDFVYGATDDKRFIPLDGQQRLTTLFLIHLYLDGLRGEQIEKLKFLFTYETRDSSRLFCEKIVANRYELFSIESLSGKVNSNGKVVKPIPSSVIRDQAWWLNRWNADPTIDGMLRMLDTIDSIFFKNWEKAATNLFSVDHNTILFQFLKLEDFYDPDDLFIKMNARGLPLTEFEIFKGKWMEQIENFYAPVEVKDMKSLIDVSWTDFLWPLRKQRPGLKNIDPFFQNILKLIIGNSSASFSIKGMDFDILFEANKKELSFSYGKYVEEYNVVFNKDMLDRIKEELDVMCNPDSIFTKFRTNGIKNEGWIDLEKEWKFFVIQDRDNNNPNYKGRVFLYALSRFSSLITSTNDSEVNQWARLIRNLVENNRFDSSNDVVKVIQDIDVILVELVAYCKVNQGLSRVNDWVAQNTFTPKGFTNSQWEEERIKAELRKDSAWNIEITEAERHPYFDGKISFILWCSGEIAIRTPFDNTALRKNIDKFKLYKEKCIKLFDKAGQKDSEITSEFLLVRAMLSKGDYMPRLSSNRINVYNNPLHRDYSWKALFGINDNTHEKALKILQQVLDDDNFNIVNVSESLKTIVNKRKRQNMPLWRRLLTSDYGDQILSYSRQGFIAFDDGNANNTLIYGSSKRSGYHSELNILYLELLLKKFRPDTSLYVTWNMGTDMDYSITINKETISYWNGVWYNDSIKISNLYDLVKYIRDVIN